MDKWSEIALPLLNLKRDGGGFGCGNQKKQKTQGQVAVGAAQLWRHALLIVFCSDTSKRIKTLPRTTGENQGRRQLEISKEDETVKLCKYIQHPVFLEDTKSESPWLSRVASMSSWRWSFLVCRQQEVDKIHLPCIVKRFVRVWTSVCGGGVSLSEGS